MAMLFQLLVLSFLSLSGCAQQDSVRGRQLRCCALIERPTLFQSPLAPNFHNLDGIAIDYIQNLERELGFTCNPLQIYNATREEFKGFTGFVRALENCTTDEGGVRDAPECNCDIGVGCWLPNQERLGRVEFLPPFVIDDFRILVRRDSLKGNDTNHSFFIRAFKWDVWLALLGLFAIFVLLKLFDRRFAPAPQPQEGEQSNQRRTVRSVLVKKPVLYRIRKACQSVLSKMVNQSGRAAPGDSHSTRQWTVNLIIFLCSLFILLIYEAAMTASLVVEQNQSRFRSIEDLAECRIMAREVCVVGGGAIEDFWNSAIAKSSCQQQETNNEVNLVENATVGIEKLISGTCSFFLLSGGTAEDFTNGPFCGDIQTTGKPFFTSGGSFLLPKGSPLSLEFGNATLALKKRGVLRTLEQYFEDRGLCSVNDPIVITFSRLRLFFILAYCAGFFMFLVIIFDRRQPKKIETKSTGDLQANGPTERVNDGVPVGVKPVGEVESDASSATDMV